MTTKLPSIPAIPVDFGTYPASMFAAFRERLDRCDDAISRAMIEGGRGHELASETMAKDDPLSLYFRELRLCYAKWFAEREFRLTWHGSIQRVNRKR